MMEGRSLEQKFLSDREVSLALSTPDLTEKAYSDHSIGILYKGVESAALGLGISNTRIVRSSPVLPVRQHFDALLFSENAGVRSSLNSRYVNSELMLRGQTAANIPPALSEFAESNEREILMISPGICFRSRKSDKQHASVVHQVDIWYVSKDQDLDDESLLSFSESMAIRVANKILPGYHLSHSAVKNPTESHPYLRVANKLKVSEANQESPLTVLEYGVVNQSLLSNSGIENGVGVSMGVILERSVMLRKKLPDVRLISSTDPLISSQMYDLECYKEPSKAYEYTRDISISIPKEMVETIQTSIEVYTQSELGIGSSLSVQSVTGYYDLPVHVRERNGMSSDQVNVLLGVKFNLAEPQNRAAINNLRDLLRQKFDSSLNAELD